MLLACVLHKKIYIHDTVWEGGLMQASTQSYGVIEAIKERLEKGPLTEFDYAFFAREAEKIKSDQPETAFSALGVLACIRGDEKASRELHEKSILVAPSSSLMAHNYAVSLARLGRHDEAMGQLRRAIFLDGTNRIALSLFVDVAYRMGSIDGISEGLARWKKMFPDERHAVEGYLDEDAADAALIAEARADVAEHGTVPWEEIKRELNL